MKRCLFTYLPLKDGEEIYSAEGLKTLSRKLNGLRTFPYSTAELRRQAQRLAGKLSIQGIQPKVSVTLDEAGSEFAIVEKGGTYILKPQVADYPQLPENEDLTMKMAAVAGLKTPWHGLLRCEDDSLAYVIRRFDRRGRRKVPQEDFAQLIGASRSTKYLATTERVSEAIEQYCTFPILENRRLFRLLVFSFLVGNEDLHLKNLSVLTEKGKVSLSPVYDVLNSTIALANPEEELALELHGKKRGFTNADFTAYLGRDVLLLPEKIIEKEMKLFAAAITPWRNLIEISFLTSEMKRRYLELLEQRTKRLLG